MSKKLSQLSAARRNSALALTSESSTAHRNKTEDIYSAIDKINGRHPWQTAVPEGFVAYPVKKLERGKLTYFNFALAREMGLIPQDHADTLTPELIKRVTQAFSIQIVNEYDQQNGPRPSKLQLKEHVYMATRYLQLQHASKQGRTSGDGRSIWNGVHRHKGVTWDISSRGTGVTCLAPGSVEADQPLRTGEGEFGYGCGLADLSELWGSAVLSEIFHLNGIGTERMLAIIDLGRGCGIGVRAAPNLIRPAHLFLYLKQGRFEPLKQAADYLIQREVENGSWKVSLTSADRYRYMLRETCTRFARFVARLEREYIFAWMDWDGDNVLIDGGIIDYGSIRQFGLRHDQYRFDDVQRFSTNLNEQRSKARLTLQVFAQLVDFLETGKRRPIEEFAKNEILSKFDREYDHELRRLLLLQVGFDDRQALTLMTSHAKHVERLYETFLALEKTKTKAGQKRVADGVNRPAVYRMRSVLRELPELVLRQTNLKRVNRESIIASPQEWLELLTSNFAKRADLRFKGALKTKIQSFQKAYLQILLTAWDDASSRTACLRAISQRARVRNARARLTGNGSEFVVAALVRAKRKGASTATLQRAIELFVAHQSPHVMTARSVPALKSVTPEAGQLFQELVSIALDFEDDI